MTRQTILVTGASGYIGGRLISKLVSEGHNVRCIARNPAYIQDKLPESVTVFEADALNPETLPQAFEGIDVIYYLIHSMGASSEFARLEAACAHNVAEAAKLAGIKRLIYLGGLTQEREENLSAHLKSRSEVGSIFKSSDLEVIEFRASIILGAGSLSFELIRTLCERLPIMTIPKWVSLASQPIYIGTVLDYLTGALTYSFETKTSYKAFEIGGTETVSYLGLMQEYCNQRKLKRLFIPVPFLSLGLSSLWLGLVTPLYARIGRKLIDSVRHNTILSNTDAQKTFGIQPLSYKDGIRLAIEEEDQKIKNTRWSDALSSTYARQKSPSRPYGNRIIDTYCVQTDLSPETVFNIISQIGGKRGWYYANFLWKIRGFIDQLWGGPGLKRKRHPTELHAGDALDWWRIESYEPPVLLRLFSEMKLPGRAWLQFEVKVEQGKTRVYQTAIYDPLGLFGIIYWYTLYPIHWVIFNGMLRQILKRARLASQTS